MNLEMIISKLSSDVLNFSIDDEDIFDESPNESSRRNNDRKKVLSEAIGLLNILLILNNEEVNSRKNEINNLSDEGLKEMIITLKDAVKKQNEYFKVLASRDHLFPSRIKMMAFKARIEGSDKTSAI